MSNAVTWRDAERKDRPMLEQFTCTVESDRLPNGRRLPHPKPWELEVQKGIRTCKPPGATDDIYRIGEDESGQIVAVSAACTIDDTDRPTYKLMVLAVATGVRGAKGEVADACLDDALAQIHKHARERDLQSVVVVGQIDPRNEPSKRLCQRREFYCDGQLSEYEVWTRYLAVGP